MKDQDQANPISAVERQPVDELTELRRRVAELEASEEELRRTLDATTDGIWKMNFETAEMFFSPGYYTMLGYEPGEFPATYESWGDLIHPDDRESALRVASEYLAAKSDSYENEFRLRTKPGDYKWVRARARVVERNEKGEAVRMIGSHEDITERKRAEEMIKQSEQDYRGLFETAHDAIIIFTPESEIVLDVNQRACEMYGFSRSEFIGMSVERISKNVSCGKKHIKETLDKGFYHHFETVQYRKDGTELSLEINASVVDYKGQQAILSINRDITERERAEAALKEQARALRESEEHFRTLIEQSPFGIEIFDADGVLRRVNKAWEELWAANPQDAVGKYNPFENEQVKQLGMLPVFERLFAGELVDLPDTLFDPAASGLQGRKRWVRAKAYHVRDQDGQVKNVVFIHEDITERKEVEEERARFLAQTQEQVRRVQQIVDTVPEGVLLLDAQARVVLTNPLGEQNLLTLANARVGDILTHLGDQPLDALLTSPPKGLWHQVATDSLDFQVIARPLETGTEAGGWVLVIRDVTQQLKVERRVQQQERLAAVGQLAAGIAHDFNNIMATIVLYAQMTARREGLPETVRDRMVTIDEQAKHATRLIQQILDFSRRSVLEQRPLDLVPLLKEHVKLLGRTLPESIEIKLECRPDEDTSLLAVNADPTRVQQMVTNLALNARDAMLTGGTLHIGLERIEVGSGESPLLPEMEAGAWIKVTVSDTGTGIPPDVLPHIFEPFFTTKAALGNGLGLAQVHGIVGQHGGRIEVDTHVGEGTTFMIYLPALSVTEEPLHVLSTDSPSLISGQGQTILVVEDAADVRQALVDSLEALNYRVLQATNGREALAMLEQHADEIDLLLSDMVMPVMGGRALLYTLREKGLTMPVVMLTGHPLEKEMEELRAQGMTDWMPKPPEWERLAEIVARALGAD